MTRVAATFNGNPSKAAGGSVYEFPPGVVMHDGAEIELSEIKAQT